METVEKQSKLQISPSDFPTKMAKFPLLFDSFLIFISLKSSHFSQADLVLDILYFLCIKIACFCALYEASLNTVSTPGLLSSQTCRQGDPAHQFFEFVSLFFLKPVVLILLISSSLSLGS